MRILDLPQDIRERAEANINDPRCGGVTWGHELSHQDTLSSSFDWSLTKEGTKYWILVDEGKFDEARELLNQPKGEIERKWKIYHNQQN